MQRRDFLLATSAVGAAALSGGQSLAQEEDSSSKPEKFKLKYAPHFGTFEAVAGKDLLDQLQYAADNGFTAWEDNGMKGKDKGTQEKIAKKMESLGMTRGVLVAHGNFGLISFTGNDTEVRGRVVQEVKDSVEVANRVNAK